MTKINHQPPENMTEEKEHSSTRDEAVDRAAHGSADWEYICVEVTRTEITALYLKVPKDWRPSGKDYKMMGRAAKETTSDSDWDNYGWENDVELQGHKPVDAKEAEQYRVFDARDLLNQNA
jgi:hypothetical protein